MILDKFKLDEKVAFVTGSSTGLGQAMAIGLAEAGADVVCHASKAGGAGETVEKSLRSVENRRKFQVIYRTKRFRRE